MAGCSYYLTICSESTLAPFFAVFSKFSGFYCYYCWSFSVLVLFCIFLRALPLIAPWDFNFWEITTATTCDFNGKNPPTHVCKYVTAFFIYIFQDEPYFCTQQLRCFFRFYYTQFTPKIARSNKQWKCLPFEGVRFFFYFAQQRPRACL